MASGIGLNDACVSTFQELKLGKKHKYIVYGINDTKTEIIPLGTSASADYQDFLGHLPSGDCRWAVYDVEYDQGEGKRNKLVFVSWSPDGASIKSKMLYASSKDALRRALVGIGTEVQATEADEISHDAVVDKVTRK